MRRRWPWRCSSTSSSPLLLIGWIYLRLFEWWRWPDSSDSWKFSPYLSECYRSCAALTASIIHPRCPWVRKCTPSLETQWCCFAKRNTNSFKFQGSWWSRPLTSPSTPPSPRASPRKSALPPNPNLRGIHNAAITFITSTFSMQMCSLQMPTRGGPSKPPDTQLTFPFYLWAPFHIHFTTGWGPANVTGSRKSVAAYFCTSADAAGFLPSPLPLLNPRGCILLASISRSHTASLDLRIQRAGKLQQSIPQWYIVGGFSSNASVFISSNGRAELRRAGPDPDRQRNTNEISLCQLHLQPGWRCTAARCLKQGRERSQRSRKKTQRGINTAWPSLQFQLGVMGSHTALVLDVFSLKWRGQNPTNAFDISAQANSSSIHKSLRAWRISVAAAAAEVKQFPENVLLFNMLLIHIRNLLLPTGIFPYSSIPAAPGAEMPLLTESCDYCLAIT